MNELLIGAVGLGIVVVVTNVYWWRRIKTVREALTVSRERALEATSKPVSPDGSKGGIILKDAAERADVDPKDLPERVEEMNENIRSLMNELDALRHSWAVSWWDALSRKSVDPHDSHVLVVPLEDGNVEVVQAFAQEAVNHDASITIILGLQDGSCSVTVGENLREEFSAAAIVDEIANKAGGGGGGSRSIATAGGTKPEDLHDVVESVQQDLKVRLQSIKD